MKSVLVVGYEIVMRFLFSMPRGRLFDPLKAMFLRMVGARIGKRVVFYPGLWIAPGRGLSVGDDADLALGVVITTSGTVNIGERVLIGYGTAILSANHKVPEGTAKIFGSGHVKAQVDIGNDVWIGANCTILPGARIGEGAVVAAGSVVRGCLPPYGIYAGVPARKIRSRV